MPLTELHGLAESNKLNKDNILLHIRDVNTVNENGALYGLDYVRSATPLHVALLYFNRTAILFLIAFGANIHLEFIWRALQIYLSGDTKYTAEGFALRSSGAEIYAIVTGGADNARDTLILEKLLPEEEKFVKPAKH